MIKKTINRRLQKDVIEKPSIENRYRQATKTVVEQYSQNKEATVYSKYYEHKKKAIKRTHQEDYNGRTI